MNELVNKVLDWSYERNIINGSTYKSQYMKAQSEAGELAKALLEEDTDEIKDAIGDVIVCLINLAEQCDVDIIVSTCKFRPNTDVFKLYANLQLYLGNMADTMLKANKEGTQDQLTDILLVLLLIAATYHYNLKDCLESAYNQIKDRKGIVFNEVFIKESDPNYQRIIKHIKGTLI